MSTKLRYDAAGARLLLPLNQPTRSRSAAGRFALEYCMRWFHDRNTLTTLLATFSLVCVHTAVVGYWGISTAQTIKADLDNVGVRVLPKTRDLATVQYNIAKSQRDVRTAVLSHDKPSTDAAFTRRDRCPPAHGV